MWHHTGWNNNASQLQYTTTMTEILSSLQVICFARVQTKLFAHLSLNKFKIKQFSGDRIDVYKCQTVNLLSRLRRMSYSPCLTSFQKDLSLISVKISYKNNRTITTIIHNSTMVTCTYSTSFSEFYGKQLPVFDWYWYFIANYFAAN